MDKIAILFLISVSVAACDLPDSPATPAQHRSAIQGAQTGTIIRAPSATSAADVSVTTDTSGLQRLQRAAVVNGGS